MLEQNLKNIINICKQNEKYKSQVVRLYDFIKTTYPMMNDDLLGRFDRVEDISELKYNSVLFEIFSRLFTSIINNESLEYDDIPKNLEEPFDRLIIIIYNYIIGKLSFNDIKYCCFLELYGINSSDFFGLSSKSALAICELSNRNINTEKLINKGNFYIEFIKDVANGKYPDTDYAKAVGDVASLIDKCFKEDDMFEYEYDGNLIYFEKTEDDLVEIYFGCDYDNAVALVNEENDFLIGSYDKILGYTETPVKPYGEDELKEIFKLI